jgi:hypothetical protein
LFRSVFEVACATSGNMPVSRRKISLSRFDYREKRIDF